MGPFIKWTGNVFRTRPVGPIRPSVLVGEGVLVAARVRWLVFDVRLLTPPPIAPLQVFRHNGCVCRSPLDINPNGEILEMILLRLRVCVVTAFWTVVLMDCSWFEGCSWNETGAFSVEYRKKTLNIPDLVIKIMFSYYITVEPR